MRKLLPSRLHVGFSPAMLEMAASDWRHRLVRTERLDVPGPHADWRAVLALLRGQMQTGNWRAGAVEVILSSHFVRHCLLPAELRGAGAAENTNYVRHLFRGEYGGAVDGWHVAVDLSARGARLACAIDSDLLAEIAATCADAKVRLGSVKPHLAATLNRVCRHVTRPRAWLAVSEGNVCAVALLESGRWRHVACARLDAAIGVSLFTVLRQQALLLPDVGATKNVYVYGAGSAGTDDSIGWEVETLAREPGMPPANLLSF